MFLRRQNEQPNENSVIVWRDFTLDSPELRNGNSRPSFLLSQMHKKSSQLQKTN